jgi:hypothetical protein
MKRAARNHAAAIVCFEIDRWRFIVFESSLVMILNTCKCSRVFVGDCHLIAALCEAFVATRNDIGKLVS